MSFHRDLGLALLPITLALSSCARAPKTTAFPSVHTAKVESRAFQPTIETISVLESTSNVAIKPESNGRVVRIVAREGQRVNAGDTILVLDDVLSAVDHKTEVELLAALRSGPPRTTLIVANRISALAHAEQILVLEEGKLTALGSHAELSQREGIYRDTWLRQREGEGE